MTLQDRIAKIQNAPTQQRAFHRFNEAMQGYGYTNNVYTLMNDHPSIGQQAFHGVATTYPADWLQHYNARNYQAVDAVWSRLLVKPVPFFWGDLINRMTRDDTIPGEQLRASLKVMNEAEDAGVADGIGISFVNSFGEITGMGLSRSRAEKQRRYEDLAEVFLLSHVFHDRFRGFYEKPLSPKLTAREREILLRASENKTDGEIGDALNISTATVRFHWKNIFAKLEVNGRLPAVMKAMRLQIVCPQKIKSPYQA